MRPQKTTTNGTCAAALAVVACILAAALLLAPGAPAQSGGTGAPGSAAPFPATPPQGEPPARSVRLLAARARPAKAYLYGTKPKRFAFTLSAREPTDLRIDILAKGQGIRRSLFALDVAAGSNQVVPWDGLDSEGASIQGRLFFRIRGVNGEPIAPAKGFEGKFGFGVYDHIFPIRGKHSYGDGLGAGRGHQGQDLPARCGTKLVAARGGTVKTAAYQASGAGNYVVIDGAGTNSDYVYMHMLSAPLVGVGEVVATGQPIGEVGSTGRSSGCHLHFEMWSSPGWYSGGAPTDVSRRLRSWDSYS